MASYPSPRYDSDHASPRRSRDPQSRPRRHSASRPSSSDATRPRRPSRTKRDYYQETTHETPQHSRDQSGEDPQSYGHYRHRRGSVGQHPPATPMRNDFSYERAMPPSPPKHYSPRQPMLEPPALGQGIVRKKSLVRPERRQRNPDDPDYHYRKHAQNMDVMPSTTGLDPQMESELEHGSVEPSTAKQGPVLHTIEPDDEDSSSVDKSTPPKASNKLVRRTTQSRDQDLKDQRRQKIREAKETPTLWVTYYHLITFWCPDAILSCMGKKQKAEQRAWREKIGLLSIIALFMLVVGFLTFGFTQATCPDGGPLRLQINHVDGGYMIFHGSAFNLEHSHHPAALGIAAGANVLWDLATPHGGQDCSFLFQNVNGACKGLITAAPGSDVPTNSDGDLAWYFPCNCYNQDGSTKPNLTDPYYLGYACHTAKAAREDFYGLQTSGDVFFTWENVRNQSRNLMVYNGDVLDLDLLEWFNTSQVSVPSQFDEIRNNPAVRGVDVTMSFSTGENRQIAECFQEIIKVGSIDTATVGCIASKVVLYVSLIFILSVVLIKFFLAIMFQWFLCRKYAAAKTSMGGDSKQRKQQIEEWTDDIYRPPPKMTDPAPIDAAARIGRRNGFFPTTSRFTSPYAIERSINRNQRQMTTMASQHSRAPSSSGGIGSHRDGYQPEMTLPRYTDSPVKGSATASSMYDGSNALTQSSQFYSSAIHTDSAGPQGFIHEAVVPQPPAEWQPFGFPLAHAICLVTAYSEGPDGIRTTLDSIAMTDYPNSHKLIFVICDGLVQGKGEKMSTPEACLSMMKNHAILPEEVQPFSYVAVASGSKRHNMAQIYSGFYDYGHDSIIPVEKQQRVPMIVLVKTGTPAEAASAKPGNRGKRDSQIILMSFLQKVMFDERMTELEYEIFNGIWKITGISPDFYEIVLMVDADTKVFPDSMTHMVSAMVKDPEIMGLCGETKIANKRESWVSMIQVFEYFISHHLAKSFESCFGGVTCLPGCFCMYRIKTPKGAQNYWVPILANPDIVEHYSENVVDTLHKKNLLLLGEDRYLSTLMLKTFPKRKQVFIPQAVCKTTVPDKFKVLLSQRRRWINSTIHNLMELVLVRDLCGTFCFSMQFVVFIDLVGCIVLPAAICFTVYVIALGIKAAITHTAAPVIPLVLLALILGLPGVLIVITAHKWSYVLWMLIYLLSLPIWNLVLPSYAYWHFDDFSWGDTRQAAGEEKGGGGGHDGDGEFDSSKITMKRWVDFEAERRLRAPTWSGRGASSYGSQSQSGFAPSTAPGTESRVGRKHARIPSSSAHEGHYTDYP